MFFALGHGFRPRFLSWLRSLRSLAEKLAKWTRRAKRPGGPTHVGEGAALEAAAREVRQRKLEKARAGQHTRTAPHIRPRDAALEGHAGPALKRQAAQHGVEHVVGLNLSRQGAEEVDPLLRKGREAPARAAALPLGIRKLAGARGPVALVHQPPHRCEELHRERLLQRVSLAKHHGRDQERHKRQPRRREDRPREGERLPEGTA